MDPNPLLAQLRIAGAIPSVPNLASATQPFGAYISLDGVHPSSLTHQVFTNVMIRAINAKYSTSLDTIAHP